MTLLKKYDVDWFRDMDRVFLDMDRLFTGLQTNFPTGIRTASFPPADIYKTDTGYQIKIAVAGYSKSELTVKRDTLNVLYVSGTCAESQETETRTLIARGIAKRSFVRKWQLEVGDEVTAVKLVDGMLGIDITRLPAVDTSTTYEIN